MAGQRVRKKRPGAADGADDRTFVRAVTSSRGEGIRPDALRDGADTAIRLLADIKERRLDARDLTKDQRQACLLFVANGTQTSNELAALFKVSPSLIRKDMQDLRRRVGREVSNWTLEEVLGQLSMAAEKCSAQAMRQEDPGLCWTIQRDFVKLLKELGVVGPRHDGDALRITIETIGAGYERARQALGRALDPRLTGEVIDVEPQDPTAPPPLPLSRRFVDEATVPGGEVTVRALEGAGEESPPVEEDPRQAAGEGPGAASGSQEDRRQGLEEPAGRPDGGTGVS